jgi:hypothetical protein
VEQSICQLVGECYTNEMMDGEIFAMGGVRVIVNSKDLHS